MFIYFFNGINARKLNFFSEVDVRQIVMHQLYGQAQQAIVYDYAILRTKTVIGFSPNVNAACLPNFDPSTAENKNLQASGWGKISRLGGKYNDSLVLKTVTIRSYPNQECCKFVEDDIKCLTNKVVLDDSVLCAGSTSQKIGVCFGDSGGPLTYYNGSRHFLVGITSYVVGSCGGIGFVDGFARVSHQMEWVRSVSDNYVKFCSAKIQNFCNAERKCNLALNEECVNGECQCQYGYLRLDTVNF